MYTLAFDTTAASCAVTLFSEDTCIETFYEKMDFGQAEKLIPVIAEILKKHDLTFAQLSLLAVCTGPGSFTGVRSSISAARAFGLACPQTEVMGINAFEAYAQSLVWEPQKISEINAVIIETKREDFYFQLFDKHLQPQTLPSAAMREDIIKLLRHKKITFLGDGVERFLSMPTGLSLHAILNTDNLDIKDLAVCAIRHYRQKQHNYPKPVYLRAPDVCVKS